MKLSRQQRADVFDSLCRAHGLPAPEHEVRFHPQRKWRFDYLWPARPRAYEGVVGWRGVAVECVGGVWTRGHHSRGKDQIADMEKRNTAQLMGYVVLEFTPQQIEDGSAFPVIKRALEAL